MFHKYEKYCPECKYNGKPVKLSFYSMNTGKQIEKCHRCGYEDEIHLESEEK